MFNKFCFCIEKNASNFTYHALIWLSMKIRGAASGLWDCGFEPHTGHDHDSSYDTTTTITVLVGRKWTQE